MSKTPRKTGRRQTGSRQADRKQRLAQALRDNLKKRKQQARARGASTGNEQGAKTPAQQRPGSRAAHKDPQERQKD